jgi:hypothetical protein
MWTDLTVPYWSMPENTDHPTQKPEKVAGEDHPGELEAWRATSFLIPSTAPARRRLSRKSSDDTIWALRLMRTTAASR